ncbi:MAG: SRPBCC family protein [Ilumatobacteraceae bacterium]
MSTTRVTRHIRAPRSRVYRALLDPAAVQHWMVPDQMTSHIHEFDTREGGEFRISLTYDAATTVGKTDDQTDTFHGRFVELVTDSKVVQSVEFDSDDPVMAGEMTITYTLTDADGGTDLVGVHENLPTGLAPADNELGWRISLDKLAALLEVVR